MPEITTADGVRIHYEVAGSGAPIVLVHGITESSVAWEPLLDRLAARGQVVAVDLRGHGRSGPAPVYDIATMAADVAQVVTAEGLDRVHLVGHSLGGAVAAFLAPSPFVRSVVDIDQSLRLADFQALVQSVEPMLRDADQLPGVLDALFAGLVGDRLPAAEIERLAALRRPEQDVVLGVWGVLLDSTPEDIDAIVTQALTGTTAPFLALHGSDPGPGYVEWLRTLVPAAEVEVWEGAGHYPQLVDPDRFLARLEAFWSAIS